MNKKSEKAQLLRQYHKQYISIVVVDRMGFLWLMVMLLLVTTIAQQHDDDDDDDDDEWRTATTTFSKEKQSSFIIQGACGYGEIQKSSYIKYSAWLSSMLFNRGSCCGGCFQVRCVDHILWCLQAQFIKSSLANPKDFGTYKYPIRDSGVPLVRVLGGTYNSKVNCDRKGGIRFTLRENSYFYQVLISNVGLDGEVMVVKFKGAKTGWIPMGRNWGQNWQCNINTAGQSLSFEMTNSLGRTLTCYNVDPPNWRFRQTF